MQLQAQSELLQLNGERQLQPVRFGQLGAAETSSPFILPAKRTRAGLSFDDAQHEYDMHEKIGAAAVKRLAGKQEKTVLNNLHKLFGRSGTWGPKREELMRIVRCQPALDQQHQRLFAQQRPVEGLWQQAVGMQAHRRIAS